MKILWQRRLTATRKACKVCIEHYKKSLTIPKGQSESVYRRRTDNTMAKRKRAKGQTTIYKTYI
jgi:hypothetical protein